MKNIAQQSDRPHVLVDMIERLRRRLPGSLQSVVLYGPMVRGESYAGAEGLQLMVLVADLEPRTMRGLSDPVRFWLRKGLPMPKLFSPEFMAEAADVFPLEFLEIQAHHELLYGRDPFSTLELHTENLRLQCERELREKMMRLREGYLECAGSERATRRLLQQSYPTFVEIFRGCLRLASEETPLHDEDVVRRFCADADIQHTPFAEVEELLTGDKPARSADEIFCSYYEQLTAAVHSIDRFAAQETEDET